MKPIRTLVLAAIAAVCLCRWACGGEPTLAPPTSWPQRAASPVDEEKCGTPILIMARSIRVAAPLDKIDALLESLAGKSAPDTEVIIRCKKTEIVRRSHGSSPEIECFGDVIVKANDLSIQAERVLKRGNTFVFEGTTGKPVQIVRQRKGKADVHLTTAEITFDLPSNRVAVDGFKAMEMRKSASIPRGQ